MAGKKKGILDVEFVFSIIVFMSMISFVTISILSNVPLFRSEAFSEDLRARTYQVSQLLLFDVGEPKNWDASTVKRIGLSTGSGYVLSADKIGNLSQLCAGNYPLLKSMLGQNTTSIRINITDASGNAWVGCGPQIKTSRSEFQITRFAVLQNNMPVRVLISIV